MPRKSAPFSTSIPKVEQSQSRAPRLVVSEPKRDSALDPVLRAMQFLSVCYPRLIGRFINAMVSEGKRFAETGHGARLHRELSEADWVEKGRILWETCGLDELMSEEGRTDKPDESVSDTIRDVRRNLAQADLEPLLSKLMSYGIPSRHDNPTRTNSGIRKPQ